MDLLNLFSKCLKELSLCLIPKISVNSVQLEVFFIQMCSTLPVIIRNWGFAVKTDLKKLNNPKLSLTLMAWNSVKWPLLYTTWGVILSSLCKGVKQKFHKSYRVNCQQRRNISFCFSSFIFQSQSQIDYVKRQRHNTKNSRNDQNYYML